MQVTVLGKSPSWPDAGGACTGLLVEEGGFTVLVDCGSGVFGKLRGHRDHRSIDAVVISHLHADHMLDLVPFSYALGHAPGAGQPADDPPVLFAPEGAEQTFRSLCGLWGPPDLIGSAFQIHEYRSPGEFGLGPFRVRTAPVPHFIETAALDFTGSHGARFTFGADCRSSEALAKLAAGSDLLFAEATDADEVPSDPPSERGHMSAAEAGALARRAGVRRLVLTHISDMQNLPGAERAGSEAFGAPVEIAREGAEYRIAPPSGA